MQMKRVLDRLRFRRDHRWVQPHASDYLDGELRPRERTRVERHLDKCPECRELLVSCQVSSCAVAGDRVEDLIGGLRPDEGLRVLVPGLDPPADVFV